MNWDDLKVFIFVAKSNNVTEAAHSLNVSASTVSRKIAALEDSLSTVLFLKKTNGYFLTQAGRALLILALAPLTSGLYKSGTPTHDRQSVFMYRQDTYF